MAGFLIEKRNTPSFTNHSEWCAAHVVILPDISDVSKQFEHISDGVVVCALRREVLHIDGPQVHVSTG